MKAQQEKMPRIEDFIRPPQSAAGEARIKEAMRAVDSLLSPLMRRMRNWPRQRRSIKELIRGDLQYMYKVWGGKVLAAYALKRDDAERDYQAHRRAGGKREDWTPWKALGVPPPLDWYLAEAAANYSSGRFRESNREIARNSPRPLKSLADVFVLLGIDAAGAFKQIATILCGGSSETAPG